MATYSFDLHRIFLGDEPPLFLLEIVFRTSILMMYLLVLLRILGQRSVGQITLFEFALIIALGSAAGDPMFYPDVPVIHGMAVITLVVAFQKGVVFLNNRSDAVQKFTEGTTERIVVDGMFDLKGLRRSRLSHNEAKGELREQEISQLGQVYRAYLEIDGHVSVFRYSSEKVKPGLPLLNPEDHSEITVPGHLKLAKDMTLACLQCGWVKDVEAGSPPAICSRCDSSEWVEVSHQKGKEINDEA